MLLGWDAQRERREIELAAEQRKWNAIRFRRYPRSSGSDARRRNLRDIQKLWRRGETCASASRNIVWQNGHAAPIDLRAGRDQLLGAIHIDALAFLLAQKHQSAAGAAAARPFARPRRIDHLARPPDHRARLVVDSRDSGRDSRGRERRPSRSSVRAAAAICDARQKLAVMLDLERSRRTRCQSSPIVRTQCGQIESIFFTLLCRMCSIFGSASCENSRSLPSRRAGSPVHRSFRSTPNVTPRCRITLHQRQHDLAALRIVRAHAAEPQAVFLRAVVDGQLVLLDELLRARSRRSPADCRCAPD